MTAIDLGWRGLALLLTLSGLGISGCSACNDCDFQGKRCNGAAVERCGGVDQVIGRKVRHTLCEGLNPICALDSEGSAECAMAPEHRCTTPGESRCEGNVRVRCEQGLEVALDCAAVRESPPDPAHPERRYACTTPGGQPAECRALDAP
jgi:hypothetical protein